jgi:hypothetical protein
MASSSVSESLSFPVLEKNRLWRHYPYEFRTSLSEEELAIWRLEKQAHFEAEVVKAIQEATDSAAAFATLSTEEMGLYYARQPDERLWKAITAQTAPEKLAEAEQIGDTIWCKKMDREEEVERMRG